MNNCSPGRKPVIAVVDDDPMVLRALGRLIRSRGGSPCLYSSAADFMESSAGSSADCVIFDVQMPGIGGLELHERFRDRGCKSPVIFITAHEDPAAEARVARSGAAGIFYKPFRTEVLWSAVVRALSAAAH